MFKKSFFHGISAGLFSSLLAFLYVDLLKDEFMYDFSSIFSVSNVVGACMFSSVLASLGYTLSKNFLPKAGEVIFSFLFATITFASLALPMLFKLPLDFDEYLTLIFPTYAMVLHFFPIVIWYSLKPIFKP